MGEHQLVNPVFVVVLDEPAMFPPDTPPMFPARDAHTAFTTVQELHRDGIATFWGLSPAHATPINLCVLYWAGIGIPESQRITHLIRFEPKQHIGAEVLELTALCGTYVVFGFTAEVAPYTGMPCECCVGRARAAAIERGA